MFTNITRRVGHNITVIDTGDLREQFAASHLIIENNKAAFVDVGTSNAQARLVHALHEAGLQESDVDYIILTHIHLDHAGGAGGLMGIFPNATLVVHPKGASHMINPERLVAGSMAVYGEKRFRAMYGTIPKISAERVLVADDGYVLDFEGRKLHFLDTPGHARHHCCIWDPASCGIFTGDTLGLGYAELQESGKPPFLICTTSPAAFEPEAMISSIGRLMALNPQIFYLTHFGPVAVHPDAVAALIRQIRQHAELGRNLLGDHQQLAAGIADIFQKAYRRYTGQAVDVMGLSSFLADDIELNARGVEIWATRIKKDERKTGLCAK